MTTSTFKFTLKSGLAAGNSAGSIPDDTNSGHISREISGPAQDSCEDTGQCVRVFPSVVSAAECLSADGAASLIAERCPIWIDFSQSGGSWLHFDVDAAREGWCRSGLLRIDIDVVCLSRLGPIYSLIWRTCSNSGELQFTSHPTPRLSAAHQDLGWSSMSRLRIQGDWELGLPENSTLQVFAHVDGCSIPFFQIVVGHPLGLPATVAT